MSKPAAAMPTWAWSMVGGLLATVLLGFLSVLGYVIGYRAMDYGWGVFVALPTILGFVASLIVEIPKSQGIGVHAITGLWTCLFGMIYAVVILREGAMCLLMAVGIVYPMIFSGNALAYAMMRGIRKRQGTLLVSAIVLAPVALAVDHIRQGNPPVREIATEITIHAPPQKIWPLLFHLDELPPPGFWMFKMGVAHPQSVRTDRMANGGNRWCVLSTGEMPETIADYDEPRSFLFEVRHTPDSMREWNPFGPAETPHLKGYFESVEGGFTLIPLPNGDTKLVGMTRYRHFYSPSAYWNLWTDKIVREVQWRVMTEIKRRAEER